ncbi:MAG: Target of rapamycin complex 1 subunit kog1, partial [Marteilia pararefringens]
DYQFMLGQIGSIESEPEPNAWVIVHYIGRAVEPPTRDDIFFWKVDFLFSQKFSIQALYKLVNFNCIYIFDCDSSENVLDTLKELYAKSDKDFIFLGATRTDASLQSNYDVSYGDFFTQCIISPVVASANFLLLQNKLDPKITKKMLN